MTKKGKKMQARSIQEIRELRERVEEKLLNLPNVVGSMIGAKVKSGKATKKLGLTIFVAEKIPPDQLGPKERIPLYITIDGRSVHTDVLQIRPLRPQASIFPGPLRITDGLSWGTIASFCRSSYGNFGLTCAHVAGGQDKNPATPDPVSVWSSVMERSIPVGKTLSAFVSPGTGQTDDFGLADAALFTLEHPELINRARSASVIQTGYPEIGALVQGGGGTHGTLTGRVTGIEKIIYNMLFDVCIRVDPPGTFIGDSGMLWKSEDGEPLAMHAYGEDTPVGSLFSGAMLAGRAARYLSVEFLNEP
jgi:hypothetical protein